MGVKLCGMSLVSDLRGNIVLVREKPDPEVVVKLREFDLLGAEMVRWFHARCDELERDMYERYKLLEELEE